MGEKLEKPLVTLRGNLFVGLETFTDFDVTFK